MNTHCERIPIKHLYNSLLPCILHWNQNHFVVLYKISKEKSFYVADPGKGKINLNWETDFMGKRECTKNRIELRSEKVQKIMDDLPPSLLRWSSAVTLSLCITLIAAFIYISSLHGGWVSLLDYLIRK